MATITGTIKIGEAQATSAATAKRQRGSILWFWALMLVSMFGIGLVGVLLSISAKADPGLGLFIGMLGGLYVYSRWSKLMTVWRFRKTLMAQGVPPDVAIRWEVTADAIAYQAGDVASRAPWQAVSEVFHEKGWWIVMVQGTPWFAADRFFETEADQRAFVREVLSHMSEDAKARSADAVRFVAG